MCEDVVEWLILLTCLHVKLFGLGMKWSIFFRLISLNLDFVVVAWTETVKQMHEATQSWADTGSCCHRLSCLELTKPPPTYASLSLSLFLSLIPLFITKGPSLTLFIQKHAYMLNEAVNTWISKVTLFTIWSVMCRKCRCKSAINTIKTARQLKYF